MQRSLFERLKSHLDKKEFTILTGARQTGKSTLLRQLEHDCKAVNIPTIFLNLENKNLLAELNESPLRLLDFLPEAHERIVVFVDEIQYLDDPSNFLKLIYDDYAEKIKLVVTGSSAFYIDHKFEDSLAGRKRVFRLLTCSFEEYLELQGKEDLCQELLQIQRRIKLKTTQIAQLQHDWSLYMLYGGYPAVITEPNSGEKIVRLAEIRDSFVKRDILESGVQNEIAFYHLFRLMAHRPGSLVNANELAGSLKVQNETINNYLYILQKCFHVSLVRPFYRNLRKELTKMPKAYLLDTGLRNSLINNFQPLSLREDKGELWENVYFRQLAEQYAEEDILFWRTSAGNEVDFIINRAEKTCAVEVKFDKDAIKANKYKVFQEAYPEIPLSFAWLNPFNEEFFRRMITPE